MKPVIGIAGNERSIIDGDAHWITYTPKNFVTQIQEADGLPLILPMGVPEDAPQYIAQIDKLLLAGGHDVTPLYYGEAGNFGITASINSGSSIIIILIIFKSAVISSGVRYFSGILTKKAS